MDYEELIRHKLEHSSKMKIPPRVVDEMIRLIGPEIETIYEQGVFDGRKDRRSL